MHVLYFFTLYSTLTVPNHCTSTAAADGSLDEETSPTHAAGEGDGSLTIQDYVDSITTYATVNEYIQEVLYYAQYLVRVVLVYIMYVHFPGYLT